MLPRVRDLRRLGAGALDLCAVAAGRVDAYFEQGLSPWDLSAGGLVATEAGATLSGLAGDPAGYPMVLVARARRARRAARPARAEHDAAADPIGDFRAAGPVRLVSQDGSRTTCSTTSGASSGTCPAPAAPARSCRPRPLQPQQRPASRVVGPDEQTGRHREPGAR